MEDFDAEYTPVTIVYTMHAGQRMQQRKITEAEIEDVIQNHYAETEGTNGSTVYWGRNNGRLFKVYCSIQPGIIQVNSVVAVSDG